MWSFQSSDDLRTTNWLYCIEMGVTNWLTAKDIDWLYDNGDEQRALTDFMIIEMGQEFS